MIDPRNPLCQVDLFVENPIPFDELHRRAVEMDTGHVRTRVASVGDLIAMKRAAGRSRDLADVEALIEIRKRMEGA